MLIQVIFNYVNESSSSSDASQRSRQIWSRQDGWKNGDYAGDIIFICSKPDDFLEIKAAVSQNCTVRLKLNENGTLSDEIKKRAKERKMTVAEFINNTEEGSHLADENRASGYTAWCSCKFTKVDEVRPISANPKLEAYGQVAKSAAFSAATAGLGTTAEAAQLVGGVRDFSTAALSCSSSERVQRYGLKISTYCAEHANVLKSRNQYENLNTLLNMESAFTRSSSIPASRPGSNSSTRRTAENIVERGLEMSLGKMSDVAGVAIGAALDAAELPGKAIDAAASGANKAAHKMGAAALRGARSAASRAADQVRDKQKKK